MHWAVSLVPGSGYIVEVPVEGDRPCILDGLLHLLTKVLKGRLLIHTKAEGISNVVDVIWCGQLGDLTLQHQREEVNE